ncbi:MAG TPA: hypothetical protein VIM10_13390 [Actinopolymorphaceae bacterium]|jgi:hypothetical protein
MNAQPLAPQSPLASAQSPLASAQPALVGAESALVIAADGRFGYCGTCAAETFFDRPWCIDGHGDLCAEWVCTDCGTAVIVEIGDYLEPLPVEAVEHVGSIAGSRRIAAA